MISPCHAFITPDNNKGAKVQKLRGVKLPDQITAQSDSLRQTIITSKEKDHETTEQ